MERLWGGPSAKGKCSQMSLPLRIDSTPPGLPDPAVTPEEPAGESFRYVAKVGLGGLTAAWWVSPWQPAGFVRLIEEPATAPRREMIARAEAVQGYRRPGTIDTMLKMLSVNG